MPPVFVCVCRWLGSFTETEQKANLYHAEGSSVITPCSLFHMSEHWAVISHLIIYVISLWSQMGSSSHSGRPASANLNCISLLTFKESWENCIYLLERFVQLDFCFVRLYLH